jgi:hypothetical protein
MKNIKADCTCPGCKISFSRDGGCNHMSCQICKTNFCYLCKNEFPKNEHGSYMITEHFSDNIIEQLYSSKCSPFKNNMAELINYEINIERIRQLISGTVIFARALFARALTD